MQYYKEYTYTNDNKNLKEITYNLTDENIINNRAINGDIVYLLNNEVIFIKERNIKNIIGILYLDSKIKYGNIKDKSYYLFKPTNKLYPDFYIPYKNNGKNYKVYSIIKFKEWNINNKLPIGTLIEVIGNIDNEINEIEHLRNFYEIRNDNFKICDKRDNDIIENLEKENIDYNVFSIDPIGSKDIDDAFHYNKLDEIIHEVGIHIASPYNFFENDLLKIMDRVSTVYTKYKKYNMLPNDYADNICSLIENKKRYALSVIITVKNNNFDSYIIKETIVQNIKNYDYDNFDKIYKKNKNLKDFMDISKIFFRQEQIDSHLLVEKWMIFTNKIIAEHLIKINLTNCIIRVHKNNISDYDNLSILNEKKELNDYLKLKIESSAKYEIYNKEKEDQKHSKLGNDFYTHFTSPIRRAVDLFIHAIIINGKDIIENDLLEKIIDKINIFTKNCKRFERMGKRINFIYSLKDNPENIVTYGYIIKIKENKLIIYIPEYHLEEKIIIAPRKFEKIMNLEMKKNEEDIITEIEYNDINNIKKKYILYQKVEIKLWVFTSFENIFDKLKVELI